MDIVAVVMASGFSKRMGTNKLLLKHNGKEIFKYIIDKINKVDFYKKVIITNNKEIIDYSLKNDFVVIKNPNADLGQSQSVILGTSYCIKKAHMFFVADMPFLKVETIKKLKENFDGKKILAPKVCGLKKNPVIFPAHFNEKLKGIKNDAGGMSIAKKDDIKFVNFSDSLEFLDIDTRENYERYCDF
ncbi:MAG: NTP transferase domain-containing protein [Tissierellia bacterium]|nr:NTP transferase domain-containing protein [Tissierellia bacterium]